MSSESVANIRTALDSELDKVEELIKSFKYQEAAECLSGAEEIFERLQVAVDLNSETHRRILQNRQIRMDSVSRRIEDGLQRREAGKREDGNIAFKCNWNDKGYKGICSDVAYRYNIGQGRLWCTHQHGRCRSFVNADPVPNDCCYEARALLDCSFGAGWDHDEYGRLIRPRKIWSAREGKIALLTTEPPDAQKRLIAGAFLIKKVWEDPGAETWVSGDKNIALDDMLHYEIEFWKHHKNPSNPNSTAWATGLFRYVSDVAILGVLEEYISKKSSQGGDTTKAEELLKKLKTTNSNSGSLQIHS